jgi:hypothetical protein
MGIFSSTRPMREILEGVPTTEDDNIVHLRKPSLDGLDQSFHSHRKTWRLAKKRMFAELQMMEEAAEGMRLAQMAIIDHFGGIGISGEISDEWSVNAVIAETVEQLVRGDHSEAGEAEQNNGVP